MLYEMGCDTPNCVAWGYAEIYVSTAVFTCGYMPLTVYYYMF